MCDFARFERKMRAEGLPEVAIRTFRYYYEQLVSGEQGTLSRAEIDPVDEVPSAAELSGAAEAGEAALARAVVIALRYFIPLIPVLAFAMAKVVPRAWSWLGERAGAERRPALRTLAATALAAWIGGLTLGVLAAAAVFGVALPADHHQAAIEAVVGVEAAPRGPLGATGESLTGIEKVRVLGHLMASSWRNL